MSVFGKLVNTILVTSFGMVLLVNTACAQSSYRIEPQVVYQEQPVKKSRWVEETVYQKQKVTKQRPVYNTENRERRITTWKPVQKNSFQEKRTIVRKPITETKYREQRIEETVYEYETEMREEQYTIRKPVVETEMREEAYTVRKKVTENLIEVQNVTTYRPVPVTGTQWTVAQQEVNQLQSVALRPRVRWLRGGYYTDNTTGQTAYRYPGLHWTQPTALAQTTTLQPVAVPQPTTQIAMVPETVQQRRPVEISRYVDQVEMRKVPVEVTRYVDEVRTRKVPVTVRKPVTKTRIEKIPYAETRYVEQEVVEKVPVTETSWQEVTQVEPYQVQTARWATFTEEVEVPRTVRRRVDYVVQEKVPRQIWMKVPVDECGVPTGPAVPLAGTSNGNHAANNSPLGDSNTSVGSATAQYGTGKFKPLRETQHSVLDQPGQTADSKTIRYQGAWKVPTPASKESTIEVPESAPLAESETLQPLVRPNKTDGSDSGQAENEIRDLPTDKRIRETAAEFPKASLPGQGTGETDLNTPK